VYLVPVSTSVRIGLILSIIRCIQIHQYNIIFKRYVPTRLEKRLGREHAHIEQFIVKLEIANRQIMIHSMFLSVTKTFFSSRTSELHNDKSNKLFRYF